jgi:hypothetical protein
VAAFDSDAFDVDAFDELAFLFDGEAPPAETSTQTPAGSNKRHKKRHYIEVDGQPFEVSGVQEAQQLLQRARALAEREAEKEGARVEQTLSGKDVPYVRLTAPKIEVPSEMRRDVAPILADIERLYRQAAQETELRLRLAKKLADEDEEDDLFLLL